MQYDSGVEDMCLCVESFTYTHEATSPVFAYGLGYDSTNYSTWAESELVLIRNSTVVIHNLSLGRGLWKGWP